MNNPVNYVDRMGNDIYYFVDLETFRGKYRDLDIENVVSDMNSLTEELGIDPMEIYFRQVSDEQEFIKKWNDMKEPIDVVIIYTHAGPGAFSFGYKDEEHNINKLTYYHAKNYPKSSGDELQEKDVKLLISMGCNTGNIKALSLDRSLIKSNSQSMVTLFLDDLGIDYVIAADGSVTHDDKYGDHIMYVKDYFVPYRGAD